MVQVTHAALQQSTLVTTEDPHIDTSGSDSSDESDSNQEGEEDGKAAAGSTGRKEEEEEMRASSSGRGDSDEVAELKRQLAASQNQLAASQNQLAASQDDLHCSELYVTILEVVALLILSPIISSGQIGSKYCRHNGIGQ